MPMDLLEQIEFHTFFGHPTLASSRTSVPSPSFRQVLQGTGDGIAIGPAPGSEPYDSWAKNFRFFFSNDYPTELKNKLENMWKSCMTNKERQRFEDMYDGMFLQVAIPGGGFEWTANWRRTLRAILKFDKNTGGDAAPDYRARFLAEDRLAEELLN